MSDDGVLIVDFLCFPSLAPSKKFSDKRNLQLLATLYLKIANNNKDKRKKAAVKATDRGELRGDANLLPGQEAQGREYKERLSHQEPRDWVLQIETGPMG